MIEHKFPFKSFIGGWYIPEKTCDDIIISFNKFKKEGHTVPGKVYEHSKSIVRKDYKESEDLVIDIKNLGEPYIEYLKNLQKCLYEYMKRYPILDNLAKFGLNSDFNVQYYPPGGGFKAWHCERGHVVKPEKVLVFMTYLNDVKNGGTEFEYLNLKTPAKKGLTLFWPVDFTHTHRGQISKKQEKYIVTGWLTYSE